ncbi:MAG: ECF-type sigma factor [Planctomycetota bacterium]|nr:ECF-type sigma factor [Planctomycetota bacterium]
MNIEASITRWIDELRDGGESAAEGLWASYFQQMMQVARRRLGSSARAAADEEDVAISAFHSFCQGAKAGRFTQLSDRHNLWPLLVAITSNKSKKQLRRGNRLKRGGEGDVPRDVSRDGSSDRPHRARNAGVDIGELIGTTPTPDFVVQVAEQLDRLLALLDATGDADLRQVTLWRMDGESTPEIAERLGCVRRTVERKLKLISTLWSEDADQ